MLRLWRATINSWNGLRVIARSEEAFRQEAFDAIASYYRDIDEQSESDDQGSDGDLL